MSECKVTSTPTAPPDDPTPRETDAPVVSVEGATKHFGARTALDGVDLTVEAGTFCVLLGPSGSGKTTLLRSIAGIERLSAGRISIGGRLVADGNAHRPPEQRNLAMVFQDYALWPHLNVWRNVAFALGRRRISRAETIERVGRMLDRVGLGPMAQRYPNELSGGEQQRVALARAMVADTDLLLFDEPLSNLDADLRERMRLEIATLTRTSGATSVYITHDQSEAFALADRIGVLCDGRLVQFGTPEEIYLRPATPFVARFTGLAGELPVAVTPSSAIGRIGARDRAPLVALRPRNSDVGPCRELLGTPLGDPPVSGQGTLLVRSAGVRLLATGDPDSHFDAVVVDSAYRGRGYDHAVLLSDGTQLVGIHDEQRWERGDHLALHLQSAACLFFPTVPGRDT